MRNEREAEEQNKRPEENEKPKEKKYKKWKLRLIVLACIAIYAGIVFGAQQSQLASATDKKSELETQQADLEERKAFLERQQVYVGSDQYTESMARDKLGWVDNNEVLFKDNSEDDKSEGTAEPSATPTASAKPEDEDTGNNGQ